MPSEVSSAIDRPKPSTPGNSAAAVMFIRRSSVQKVWLDLIWNDDLLEMGPCDFRRDADVVLMEFRHIVKRPCCSPIRALEKNLNATGTTLQVAVGLRNASCKCFAAGSSSSVLVRSGGSDPYSFRKTVCSRRRQKYHTAPSWAELSCRSLPPGTLSLHCKCDCCIL